MCLWNCWGWQENEMRKKSPSTKLDSCFYHLMYLIWSPTICRSNSSELYKFPHKSTLSLNHVNKIKWLVANATWCHISRKQSRSALIFSTTFFEIFSKPCRNSSVFVQNDTHISFRCSISGHFWRVRHNHSDCPSRT